MKTLRMILIISTALLPCTKTDADPAETAVTNAPACIRLHDQFNALEKLSFPTTNLTLLTIADGRGSEQIAGWVKPVKQRFDGRIDIRGIADMSCVPRPLRGLVRTQFQAVQHYPVMLDWTGDVVNEFAYQPGEADILVLDRDGKIIYRARGKATEKAIQNLCAVIDQALSAEKPESPAK
jgi:hypothetical protein